MIRTCQNLQFHIVVKCIKFYCHPLSNLILSYSWNLSFYFSFILIQIKQTFMWNIKFIPIIVGYLKLFENLPVKILVRPDQHGQDMPGSQHQELQYVETKLIPDPNSKYNWIKNQLEAKLPARIELATFRLRSERTTTMLRKLRCSFLCMLFFHGGHP